MTPTKLTRRHLLKTAAASAVITSLPRSSQVLADADSSNLEIREPFHGAVLNHLHGRKIQKGLAIPVTGTAPPGRTVTVNGQKARRTGRKFHARVTLHNLDNTLTARSENDSHQVRVIYDKYSCPRYRLAIDDNIFFLRDIAENRYKSLFDCWYLKMLRDLHQKYGTKFVLNIFYHCPASDKKEEFDLSQFPDTYKNQWRDNAHWLRLAFHAYAEQPDRPYQNSTTEKLINDFRKVGEQIHRFAGPKTYSPTTVIHWAMVPPDAFTPLYKNGVRVLSAYFTRNRRGWDINYGLDPQKSLYLNRHYALKDFDSGIIFSRNDIVLNMTTLNKIVPKLRQVVGNPDRSQILDLLTHEQYFWPHHPRYLPDHKKRLETAIKFATEQGYKPVFLHDSLPAKPHST